MKFSALTLLIVNLLTLSPLCISRRQKEVQIDLTGNSISFEEEKIFGEYKEVEEPEFDSSNEQSVVFVNNFDFDVTCVWRDPNDDSADPEYIPIADIDANSKGALNTQDGHVFSIYKLEAGIQNTEMLFAEEQILDTITILRTKVTYMIGPTKDSAIDRSTSYHAIEEEEALFNRFNIHTLESYTDNIHCAIQVRSLYPRELDFWYDDGEEGSFHGHLRPGKETTVNSYFGHTFYFTEKNDSKTRVHSIVVDPDQVLYIVRAKTEEDEALVPRRILEDTEKQLEFMRQYEEKNGIKWRHYYANGVPRSSPVLFMWPADRIGQVHEIESAQGYWTCRGSAEDCKGQDPITLRLTAVSTHPKVFVIENFLSDFECDAIIKAAKPKVKQSEVGDEEVGALETSTRTSKNAWISRGTDVVTDTLYRRAANLLNLEERILSPGINAEMMQVVYYQRHQRYDAHHDWGVSGSPESRFITLLFYLTDMKHENAGGETAFPKAMNGTGFKIHPGKGNAVLFYNLLEDGNGDDLSLHAALPVVDGEKWLANFWVWDPVYQK